MTWRGTCSNEMHMGINQAGNHGPSLQIDSSATGCVVVVWRCHSQCDDLIVVYRDRTRNGPEFVHCHDLAIKQFEAQNCGAGHGPILLVVAGGAQQHNNRYCQPDECFAPVDSFHSKNTALINP